jgi:hypothetical protein
MERPPGAGPCARALGLRAMRDPLFPWTFLGRNLAVLARESGWQRLSPRNRRAYQRRLCIERCRFFLELRSALERRSLWFALPIPLCSIVITVGNAVKSPAGWPNFPRKSRFRPAGNGCSGRDWGAGTGSVRFCWKSAAPAAACAPSIRGGPCRAGALKKRNALS